MMAIQFKSSPKPTLGVEIEIQLLDKATKDLTPAAIPIILATSGNPKLRVKSEFTQAMVEINTDICQTVADVRKSLEEQFALLSTTASAGGLELAVSGTHPFQSWWERKVFPSERYQKLIEKFQWLARRLSIFGLHVHVGVSSGDRAIHIINTLMQYIPHLLALSASSPFWNGRDTGLASSRVAVLESFPMGGPPYYFVNWKEFEKYFETLQSGGAIQSIKDIYWDIRPHFDFGTIEVRICDGLPTLKEALGLVALVQCLVVWINNQYEKGTRPQTVHMQRYWLVPENKWQAARYGLDGILIVDEGENRRSIRDDIAMLLETLQPVAQELQCEKELFYVKDILKEGNSATRQRKIFAEKKSLVSVVEALAEEFKSGFSIPSPK